MSYTFDGSNRLIILAPGLTALDVQDCYSRWKEWLATGDNAKFLPAFSVVGGDPTVGANSITPYFFLLNGWRIRPYEGDHTLTVDGILIADGGADPFADTIGVFRVRIVQVVPLQAEQITVYAGGPAPDPNIALIAKILRNKQVTNPATGTITVYDDDNVTPLLTANLFEDAQGGTPYRGQGAERRERLE